MAKEQTKSEQVNFFVPMVDLMVSIIFVFIIIVMVLLLLISSTPENESDSDSEDENNAPSIAQGIPVKATILERAIGNQSAKEILVNDVIRELLEKEGNKSIFDVEKGQLEILIKRPITQP